MSNKESIWKTAYDASKDSTVIQTSEVEPGVFVVQMNAPESHNILTPQMMGAVAREVDRLSAMKVDEITAIILMSSGKSFCAGIDINAIRDDPTFEEYITRSVDPFYAVQESPVPTIACVQGAAMTGGFELALSCDIVIASRDAVFRDNHAMYGVHQIRGLSQILPRVCGPSNAKLASLASMPVTASKALAWNIVSEVVDTPEDLFPMAMRITKGFAYNNGPILRALKKTMNEAYELSYGEARKLELTSDVDYYASLGDDKPRILTEGAKRFNKRVEELGTTAGMRGGMVEED
ncbi:hypothetical protein A1O7_04943 [Cladophialophora yegresii CBS 114405]|uniref:Enoyl-CoA hydratase n=1 Tax=Cladophialophora yegresii CBS 114405 TaxID=1182544 RepID=W9W706_9EURO|nr:uncharacterized protein A1O7_04943 [Cladophialophora yegresii CBS 114405]EXJ60790.1 hypothetical protein A1O7_04943 [Cladophialophora yegresii CBS 114405]